MTIELLSHPPGEARVAVASGEGGDLLLHLHALVNGAAAHLERLQGQGLVTGGVAPSVRPPRIEQVPVGRIPVAVDDIHGRDRLHVVGLKSIDQRGDLRGVFDQVLRLDLRPGLLGQEPQAPRIRRLPLRHGAEANGDTMV